MECYYGYTLSQLYTNLPLFSGHTAVARACRTPYLDFYVAPPDYNPSRRAGGDVRAWNIVDSLRLHNKLFLYEYDNRSFLAEMMPKTFSQRETVSVFRRDFAAALTHNTAFWWLDFGDGQRGARSLEWFCDPAIADLAAHTKRVYDYALTLPDRSPSAQIAVFYHGETHTGQRIHPPTIPLNVSLGRLTLFDGVQRIGAPADLYNLADIPLLAKSGRLDQYKMCLFLNPFYLTEEERQSLELQRAMAGRSSGCGRLVWRRSGSPLAGARLRGDRDPRHPLAGGRQSHLPHASNHRFRGPRPASSSRRSDAAGERLARFGNVIAPLLTSIRRQPDPRRRSSAIGCWTEDAA